MHLPLIVPMYMYMILITLATKIKFNTFSSTIADR